jgi:hypothetical protein
LLTGRPCVKTASIPTSMARSALSVSRALSVAPAARARSGWSAAATSS